MDNGDSKTVWCGNLSDKVTEEVLYELFLQAAPLEDLRIPIDKCGRRANYAFIVVKHEASIDYVVQLLNGTKLYDRNITVRPRKAKQSVPDTPPFENMNVISALQMPVFLSPPFQQNFQERPHLNKPYHRHDNYPNRHGWKSRHGHNNERNRRWHH